jgi:hypothetical protein
MSERPSFRQTIVLIASGAGLALFGCLGSVAAGDNGPLVAAGATGFVVGALLLLVNVWRLFRYVPVGQWPRPSNWRPNPPGDGSTRGDRDAPPRGRN